MKSFFQATRRFTATLTPPAVSPWYIDPIEYADDWCGGFYIAIVEPPESQTYYLHDATMIEKYNIRISAGGSMTVRLRFRDKALGRVSRGDISSIKLNVFETLDPTKTVDGYANLTVPTTAILESWEEDETGQQYNFEHNPFHDSKPMFPNRNTTYTVEVIATDLAGKPYARQIRIDAV